MIAADARRCDHREQRGEDAPDAALVEMRDGEAALLHLAVDERGDQVARDDEEDIDADKAARERPDLEVIEHHRQHRERAQPVDIGAVADGVAFDGLRHSEHFSDERHDLHRAIIAEMMLVAIERPAGECDVA